MGNEVKKMSTSKKVIIGIGLFVAILIVIGMLTDSTPAETTGADQSSKNETNQTSKQWKTIYTIKGNGSKKSPIFNLSGEEAKIVYSYTSSSTQMGALAIYVVDKGTEIMKDGGIPEVMIDKSAKSESALQKSAGEYYLDINGMGDWEITIMENK